MTDLKLPDGWTSEHYVGCGTSITWPAHGGVTIDWERRGFRSGYSVTGALTSTAKYTGRGWKQRLVDDAVAWLRGVWEPSAKSGGGR